MAPRKRTRTRTRPKVDVRTMAERVGLTIKHRDPDGQPLMMVPTNPDHRNVVCYKGLQKVLGEEDKGLQNVWIVASLKEGWYHTHKTFGQVIAWASIGVKE